MTQTPPMPLEQAQQRLCALVDPLGTHMLAAEDGVGHYLAADVTARRTQPPADLSAMDGYAVCADDLGGPWEVVGESAAGHPFEGTIGARQAVRISTGAIMPAGSEAVLLQENAARTGHALSLNGEGHPTPRHIRKAGFDFASGDLLLSAGSFLGPAQLALAISGGHGKLSVHKRPSLAVIDSGDELAADPASCAAHQIPASNGPAISALARPFVSQVTRIGPVRDTMEAMLSALEKAGAADVIVTSGGASVGDHDLVRPALQEWGATIDFWRVAMKPGKPVMVARRGRQVILGLPGNPVSSFVTAYLFLLPLLRRMAGALRPLPEPVLLPCAEGLPGGGKRTEFLRGREVNGGVQPIAEQDSSALRALAEADVLIRRDIDASPVTAGELVQTYRIQNGGIA